MFPFFEPFPTGVGFVGIGVGTVDAGDGTGATGDGTGATGDGTGATGDGTGAFFALAAATHLREFFLRASTPRPHVGNSMACVAIVTQLGTSSHLAFLSAFKHSVVVVSRSNVTIFLLSAGLQLRLASCVHFSMKTFR